MVNENVEQNKPLAYILGNQPFHPLPLPLIVRPPTLIPRPETEYWVAELARRLITDWHKDQTTESRTRPLRVLDIGTGSGCIPLALAFALKQEGISIETVGVDISDSAVALACENIDLFKQWLGDSVKIRKADVFAPDFVDSISSQVDRMDDLSAPFDVVVSNPPYIPRAEYEELDRSVIDWEDRGALLGDRTRARADGLEYYEQIVKLLDRLVSQTGKQSLGSVAVAFEVGRGQHCAVADMLAGVGLDSEVVKDQWAVDRLVLGLRSTSI
ncbi:hypothetical protein OIV83_001174 [Microbotryomycetes sp. JL201]|nr:hypothetical protein OIV83_001174 [Microbotryomycetes sp. JL201]